MAIRSWSFTKLWAATAAIWVIAGGASAVADYFNTFELGAAAIAFLPAFLTGAWAGEHPEIRDWPKIRLISMWAMLGLCYFGLTDFIHHWRLAAAVGAAPAMILTLRWFELAGHFGASLPPSKSTDPRLPAAGRD